MEKVPQGESPWWRILQIKEQVAPPHTGEGGGRRGLGKQEIGLGWGRKQGRSQLLKR